MSKKVITVKELVDKFQLNVIANKNVLNNIIEYVSITRAGLELTGYFTYDTIKSIIYLGSKESGYLDSLDEKQRTKSIELIFKHYPPVILLGKNFKFDKLVLDLASKYKQTVIIKTDYDYSDIQFTLSTHMTHVMADYKQHHGTLIVVFGVGILLIGKPGVGKSEISMELIRSGHIFVGDDAIDIARIGSVLRGKSSELTKGFIEVRGLGLLNFQKTFGYHKLVDNVEIQVVIELVDNKNSSVKYERLGKTHYKEILGINLPYYKLPVAAGRRMSELIECVICDYKLKKQGYDSTIDLTKKIKGSNSHG